MKLPNDWYYEAELIPMGTTVDMDGLTADEKAWNNGQTYWNIWVTLRNDETGLIDDIMDLDIPVNLKDLAMSLFLTVESAVDKANRLRVKLS